MADIIFNVEELICESPVITDAHYVIDTEHFYSVSWTSQASYYDSVAGPVTMDLYYSIDGGPFTPYPSNPVAFNYDNFVMNFNTIGLANDNIRFMLKMTTAYCSSESNIATAYTIF